MRVLLEFTNLPLPLLPPLEVNLQPGRLGDVLGSLVATVRIPGLHQIKSVALKKTTLSPDLIIFETGPLAGIRKEGAEFVVGPLNAALSPPTLQVEGVWDEEALRRWALEVRQRREEEERKRARKSLEQMFAALMQTNAFVLAQRHGMTGLSQLIEGLTSRKEEARTRFKNCLIFHHRAAALRQLADRFLALYRTKERAGAFAEFVNLLEKASDAIQIVHPDDYAAMSANTAQFESRLKQGFEAINSVRNSAPDKLIVSTMFAHDKSYIVTIGSAADVLLKATEAQLTFAEQLAEYAKGESNTNVFTGKMQVASRLKDQFAEYRSHPPGSPGYFALWDRLSKPILAAARAGSLFEALAFIDQHIDEIASGFAPLPRDYLADIVRLERQRQREREEREKKEAEEVLLTRTGLQLAQAVGIKAAQAGLQKDVEVTLTDYSGDEPKKIVYIVTAVDSTQSNKLQWSYKLKPKG